MILKSEKVLLGLGVLLASFIGCGGGRGPIQCGGAAGYKCPPSMYCKLDENCGGMDKNGTCASIPESCSPETEIVCGCDGMNYDSECWAAVKLATIKHKGAC